MRKKVLMFSPFYMPGVKGGGPINSAKNLADNLKEKIDFYIVTSDRDLGDTEPYPNIEKEKWLSHNSSHIYYIDSKKLNNKKIYELMTSQVFDYYYLNSFFNYKFSILPIMIKTKYSNSVKGNIILAPRGEFSEGALALKKVKKRVYIQLFKRLVPFQQLIWHATTNLEKEDIIRVMDKNLEIRIAENLTKKYNDKIFNKQIKKNRGEVKLIFLSRISPKKNLLFALQLLEKQTGKITFDIYGPIEDKEYWEKCKEVINELPINIKANYKGVVNHDDIINTFEKYHFFLFPTFGENFGHVISESLISGTPVVISDQTPWVTLHDKNVGWDIPLNEKEQYINVIHKIVNMEEKTYKKMSIDASSYGMMEASNPKKIEKSLELFE